MQKVCKWPRNRRIRYEVTIEKVILNVNMQADVSASTLGTLKLQRACNSSNMHATLVTFAEWL